MKDLCKALGTAIYVIGLAGVPGNIRLWRAVADWNYWLDSGDWLPWSIRAVLAAVLGFLAMYPEANIRLRDKLFPKWPDGTPMGFTYRLGWWRGGVEHWWEERKRKR